MFLIISYLIQSTGIENMCQKNNKQQRRAPKYICRLFSKYVGKWLQYRLFYGTLANRLEDRPFVGSEDTPLKGYES